MRSRLVLLAALVAFISLAAPRPGPAGAVATIDLKSSAFESGGRIPAKYAATACSGENLSPPLEWGDLPALTQSLVLTVYDPDAGDGAGFWHWVVYDMPKATRSLASTVDGHSLPSGAVSSENDAGVKGYFGPCPPRGPLHHYKFTLYALDTPYVQTKSGRKPKAILDAVSSHVLATGTLTGTFQR